MTARVLLIEADRGVAELLAGGLKEIAGEVHQASDGLAALALAESAAYALIVLELMMPLLGGPALCSRLRTAAPHASLLAVTARGDLVPALLGTRGGFDDYVPKPFQLHEVVIKAKFLLDRHRRAASAPSATAISGATVGALSVDAAAKRVLIDGMLMRGIAPIECEVVRFLANNAGLSFSSEEILAAVCGIHQPLNPRHIGVDFSRLREKLADRNAGMSYLRTSADGRHGVYLTGREGS